VPLNWTSAAHDFVQAMDNTAVINMARVGPHMQPANHLADMQITTAVVYRFYYAKDETERHHYSKAQ